MTLKLSVIRHREKFSHLLVVVNSLENKKLLCFEPIRHPEGELLVLNPHLRSTEETIAAAESMVAASRSPPGEFNNRYLCCSLMGTNTLAASTQCLCCHC